MTASTELACYLQSALPEWRRARTFGQWRDGSTDYYFPQEQRPTAIELARAFFEDAEFHALNLAGILTTPEGKFFAAVLEQVSPPFLQPDERLIVDAPTLAVKMQQQGKQKAGLLALGAVLAGVFLLWTAATG